MKRQERLILFILSLGWNIVSAQNGWTLEKDKDGIKVSSRHSATSPFNDVRVEVDLPGNIDQLAAILEDIPGYTTWAYATKKSVLIKKLAPGKLIYFSEIEVPWPATNRFYYAHFEMTRDQQNHTLSLIAGNISGYQPIPKDLIEVPYSKGVWNVKTISPKTIHVDYVLELNPGNAMPAWVINLFTTKGPFETFENVKEKMNRLNP